MSFWPFFGFVSGVVWSLGALAFWSGYFVDRAAFRRGIQRLRDERRALELAEARLRQAQMERWSLAPRRVVPPPDSVRWN